MIRFAPSTTHPLLVVDDEAAIRRAMARHLERAGYQVRTAGDAREADVQLGDDEVALVLCDIDLPGESGLSLVDRIGQEHPTTAVVMVTGVDDPGVAQVALDRGAYGYVIKPFERNELLINVANALRRRSLELENHRYRCQLEQLVEERTQELGRSREELIERLACAADFKDSETAEHLHRMRRYSTLLAERFGMSRDWCELLRLAAPMHDIGKIGIPDSVLCKQGRYTPADREVMERHPEIGFHILEGSDSELVRMAATVAYTHHERYDGSGYPRGLAGEDIPIEGRIVAIADVFDALTSKRRYKEAMSFEEAQALMEREAGAHFDPKLVALFFAASDEVRSIMERSRERALSR